jgi:hypothetical protein
MSNIYLRLINGIQPPLPVESAGNPVEFHQPSAYGRFPINLKLSPTGDVLESTCSVELHSKLGRVFQKRRPRTSRKRFFRK